MRGNLFGILALGVLIAVLPAMFEFDAADSLGSDFVEALSGFVGPVVVMLFLVACAALVVSYAFTDGF